MSLKNAILWRELELLGAPQSGHFCVRPTSVATAHGTVMYGLSPDGLYHIFVPVAAGTPFRRDTRSAGVHLEFRVLEDVGQQESFLDLSCRKPHLRGVFVHLAEDVLGEIARTPEEPEAACKRVLSRWRELLDRESHSVLSSEALLGLYGELWVLRRITTHKIEAHRNWAGPFGAVHDFRSRNASLEVKSTLAREGWRLEIHGVNQLAPTGGAPLYLVALSVDSTDPNGESVPELLEALTTAGADKLELLKKMASVGYDSRDEAFYLTTRYAVREARWYVVDSGFPKIVPESFVGGAMPAGVERLRYTVDLSALRNLQLAEKAVESVIQALAEVA